MRLTILALLAATAFLRAEIPKGTHALLRMVNSVSTRTAREGDYVYLRTRPRSSPAARSGPRGQLRTGHCHPLQAQRTGQRRRRTRHPHRDPDLPSGKVVKMTPSLTSDGFGRRGQKVSARRAGSSRGRRRAPTR